MKERIKKLVRDILLIGISIGVLIGVFRIAALVRAGNLTAPGSVDVSSMPYTMGDIYALIASSTYDSSAISASSTGNALQLMKCAIAKIRTGTCP